jgi:YVTN family beta-propeller protein
MSTALRISLVVGLVMVWAGAQARAEDAAGGYKILKKIEVTGDGGWDYLTMDAESHRLYIARSNRVQVVDIEEGKLVGEVTNTPGIHGIALAPKWKRGFTSNGSDDSVTIFDLGTLKEISRVKVGKRPDAIIYDPATDRIFTFNAGSKDATALSAEKGEVVGTVALEGKPESGVADGKGMIYVNIEDKNELVAFDAEKLTVKNRWPLTGARGRTAWRWIAPSGGYSFPSRTRRCSWSTPIMARSSARRPSARAPTPRFSIRKPDWLSAPMGRGR